MQPLRKHRGTGALLGGLLMPAVPAACNAQCPEVWLPVRDAYVDAATDMAVWNGPTGASPDRLVISDMMRITIQQPSGWRWFELQAADERLGVFAETVAVFQNNVYVGGAFAAIDHKPLYNIASWDGQSWSPLGA